VAHNLPCIGGLEVWALAQRLLLDGHNADILIEGDNVELIGKGLYTIPEVSRWTGIPTAAVRRWALGYQAKSAQVIVHHPPVFTSELAGAETKVTLSFLDLVELLFIHEFRKHGISWKVIRKASESATSLLGTGHPFAQKKLYTDKKTIFVRMVNEVGDPDLLDLYRRQFEMEDIVLPLLYESLDFDHFDMATKWWPMGRTSEVVLDPTRNFGRPIMNSVRVPTETLYDAYLAEQSIERVAEWFEVLPSQVQEAVSFQEHRVA